MADSIDAARLDEVAAMAKRVADDLRNGRLWPGDLRSAVGHMRSLLELIREDRR